MKKKAGIGRIFEITGERRGLLVLSAELFPQIVPAGFIAAIFPVSIVAFWL
jgi:hypothetical protein